MSVTIRYVRDDGEEFKVDDELYRITELDGWDYPSIGYTMQRYAGRNGGKIQNYTINETDRTAVFVLMNRQLIATERQRILSFFNPNKTFKVYLTYQGVTRWCEGRIIGFKDPTINIYKQLEISVTTISENPYLQSVDEFGKDIAAITPMHGFPYVSILDYGFVTGVYNFNQEAILQNDGHDNAYMKVQITFTGEATNPSITKDDNHIKIIDNFQSGDFVEIDLTGRVPKILKNGKSIIGKLDKTSKPLEMYLKVGTNKVRYNADDGSGNMSVYVFYNQQFLGI